MYLFLPIKNVPAETVLGCLKGKSTKGIKTFSLN